VGPVTGGILVHPWSRAAELLRFWRDFVLQSPPELTCLVVLGSTPDGAQKVALVGVCHSGEPAAAERDLAPLRSFGPPLTDQVGVMPYADMQLLLDKARKARGVFPGNTPRSYWKADFMEALSDDAIDSLVRAAEAMVSPLSQVHIHNLGGAMAAEPTLGSAFPSRDAAFVYNLVADWKDSDEDALHVGWARSWFENVRPYSRGGAYINFLGDDGEARVRAAYGSNYDRLAAIKRRYDPDNFFKANQNIRPGA
jgi:hypothetical protein